MQFSLDQRQRRDLWGLALCSLALLLALAFFPAAWLGAAGTRWFPTGNIVGLAGREIARAGHRLFGLAAVLLVVAPALWGPVAFDRVKPATAGRWSALVAGLLLLLPASFGAVAHPSPSLAGGWLGTTLGGALTTGFGLAGASVLLGLLFASVCIITVRWNPVRATVRGGRMAGARAREEGRRLAERLPPATPTWPGRRPDQTALASAAPAPAPLGETGDEPTVLGPAIEDPASVAVNAVSWDADRPYPEATLAPAVTAGLEPEPHDPIAEEVTLLWESPRQTEAVPSAPGMTAGPALPAAAAPPREGGLHDSGNPEFADLPPAELLSPIPPRDEARNLRALDEAGRVLLDKLATFRIQGELVGRTTGPVVTQFEVEPAAGVKVSRIANLEADLALAMRAASVRIVAPIPGKGAVGVEVPNPEPEMVVFREVIESPAFRASRAQLPIALGKDLAGRPYVADLAKTPHLLIAGATGSGKSVCVNTIITSLIFRHTPRTLRLLMVDPKMVELSMYNALPHLRHPVVTDNNEAASVLKWAVLEMERRYQLLSANGVRNLQDFNKRVEEGALLRATEAQGEEGDPDRWIYQAGVLPYVVLIIDELADLMMTVQNEVEKPLALLAQKARAIGIHLILATQRPSVNVITGLIKANFPSRIAFRVSSKIDSRTILDQNGADSLLGNGDMLFLPPAANDPVRIQGAYLSTEETESLMTWYRARAEASGTLGPEDDILDLVRSREHEGDDEEGAVEMSGDWDRLFRDAAEVCIQAGSGSTSLLQRRLRVGYGRAARIIDQLHQAGVLGPPDGSKPREVLVSFADLDGICPAEP